MSKQETYTAAEYRAALSPQRRLPCVVQAIGEVKRSKYGSKRTFRHDRWFDSEMEADRADTLLLLQRAHVIRGLGFQPKVILHGPDGEPVSTYKADFVFFEGGREVLEDVKGHVTAGFRAKLRHFRAEYPNRELRIVDGAGNRIEVVTRAPKGDAA